MEYKDIQVTSDGKTLFSSDFTKGTDGWKFLGDGEWSVADGALRQNNENQNVRAIAGDKSWTDYTLSLKARKLGGAEGFLVLFRVNNEDEKSWWNSRRLGQHRKWRRGKRSPRAGTLAALKLTGGTTSA